MYLSTLVLKYLATLQVIIDPALAQMHDGWANIA